MSNLIYEKMNLVMKDIGSVGKDSTNPSQGFKFRGIDAMMNALYPCLVRHGVFMTTELLDKHEFIKDVTRSNGKAGVDKHVGITMKYTFHAEDGSSVSSSIAAEGVDSGDKATNKSLSAALKYVLIQTFCVPTVDMEEADFVTVELGSEKKPAPKATVVKQEAPKEDNPQTKSIMEGSDTKPVVEAPKKAKPSFNKKTPVKTETNEEVW